MPRTQDTPVGLSLLTFGGVVVVVAFMASLLLGPSSPLRSSVTQSPGAQTPAALMSSALILAPVVLAAFLVGYMAFAGTSRR